ncbi:AraC family transcriptional regulator [Paenibacillus agaridevorans]|uniref:AraC family transcriptional regulator n=1 Tax=Paenibacillus agaridevorans TaxID=171404 RepID=UPI001BE3E975|nr:AraC family transcriptional regulator [Paenibacillus agaridevorans]
MRVLFRIQQYINQKLLLLLLVLTIIPVVGFGTIAYIMGANLIKSNIDQLSRFSLQQAQEHLNLTITQIEQNINQFAIQSNVVELSNIGTQTSLGAKQSSNIMRNDLAAMTSSHDVLESIYYYHFAQKTVISSALVTDVGSGSITDLGWLPFVEQGAQQSRNNFWIPGRLQNNSESGNHKWITYIRFTPLFSSEHRAALIANTSTAKLAQVIQKLPITENGNVILFAPDGNIILQSGHIPALKDDASQLVFDSYLRLSDNTQASEMRYDGNNYRLAFSKAGNGWIFAAVSPMDRLFAPVNDIKVMILLITGVLAALAFMLSLLGIKQLQGNLRRIANALFRNTPHINTSVPSLMQHNIDGIERGVSNLIEEVQEANIRWQEHLPLLKTYFLFSVLLDHTATAKKLAPQYSSVEPFFEHPNFIVFICEMDEPPPEARFAVADEPLFLFAAGQMMDELLKEKVRAEVMVTRKNVLAILNLPDQWETNDIVSIADHLREQIRIYLKQTMTIGIGAAVRQFSDISSSYYDAMSLLQHNWMKSGDATLSSHQNGDALSNRAFNYPAEEEERMIDAIRSGDAKLAEHSFEHFASYLAQRQVSPHITKTFYLQLLVSIVRVLQDFEEDLQPIFAARNPFAEFMALDNQQTVRGWLKNEVIAIAAQYIGNRKNRRKQDMVASALRIIEQTYRTDLSLKQVADQLQISTPTLSLVFKEIQGENFIDYITRFRVEKVKAMLRDTNLVIGQIAEEVGYNNAQQLIRVFKKIEGITPGDYRKQQEVGQTQ